MSDSKGIVVLDIDSHKQSRLLDLSDNYFVKEGMRTNDGVMLGNKYLFGTMYKTPTKGKGQLFLYDHEEEQLLSSEMNVAIPNTFIEVDDAILVSDSLEQKVYRYSKASLFEEREVWADFSNTNMTPDGGCLSEDGKIYIAMWGGACVKCFDTDGNELGDIPVEALQPTNCVISNSQLYVTSARDGLSPQELGAYPLSGAVFKINLGEACE